eukprot:6194120-Pleurochrysis_carterae.AAC.1
MTSEKCPGVLASDRSLRCCDTHPGTDNKVASPPDRRSKARPARTDCGHHVPLHQDNAQWGKYTAAPSTPARSPMASGDGPKKAASDSLRVSAMCKAIKAVHYARSGA